MEIRFFNTYEPVTDFYRDLIPALTSAGFRSHVVISGVDYRAGRSALRDVLVKAGGRLTAIPAGVRRADTAPKKLLAMLTYSIGCMALSLFGRAPAVNFFLSQPPLFAAWGRVLRALRGTPYCCLVMDLYPQVLAANGALDEASWVYRALCRLMMRTLAAADCVFVVGRCMRDRLVAEGVAPGKIVVAVNWANETTIRPVPRADNELARQHGIGGEFVVLYSGNMGVGHDFRTILAAAERLRGEQDIRFVFFGEGARRREVEREVTAHKLDNVILGGLQPAARMAESQSLGDVHFVTIIPAFTGLIVPSKAYSALAAGRPILYEGSPTCEIAQMILEEDIGRVLAPGDVDGMVETILAMRSGRAQLEERGRQARRLAEGALGQRAAIARYVEALTTLLGRRQ